MELAALMNSYLRRRAATGELCAKSVRAIRYRLLPFAEYVAGVPIDDLRRTHVEDWLVDCELRPRSYNAYLSSLRVFFDTCIDREELTRNPTRGIRPVRVPPGEARGLTREEVAAVLAHAGSAENRTSILLMVQLGLRCIEVGRIRMEDVNVRERSLGVRGKNGDGDVTRHIYIVDEAWDALRTVLAERGIASGYLFADAQGRPRSPWTVSNRITEAFARAGVKTGPWDGRSAHALRHTCAEDMAANGATVRQIQRTLGHSNAATTEQYLRAAMRLDEIRGAMEGRRYAS
jgi:integrase